MVNIIKEDFIEESILDLLGDIFEYDSVVNEFFLPMIKSKISNSKEEIEKATKHLNNEMDEAVEEFYKTKKDKEKDDGLSL